MSFTVKAYLEAGGQIQEVRRFGLDPGVSSNHSYLVQKLSHLFPSLQGKSFTTYWKDPEGDRVAFSSDEELMEALSYKDDIFKVFLEVDGSSSPRDATDGSSSSGEGQLHRGVVCDGCQGPISGMRYKCVVCPDFDLCSGCERKSLHAEHDMLRIARPRSHRMPGPCPRGGCGWRGSGPWRRGGCGWRGSNPRAKWCHEARGEPSDPSSQQDAADSSTQQEAADFLHLIGEQVSALLEPFGVNVSVDPKPSGSSCDTRKEPTHEQEPEARASSCGAGGEACRGRTTASANGSSPVGQQPPAGEEEMQQLQQQLDAMLEAKVASAVEAMRVMGFHDDDGWLSSVLRNNGVDVQKAVGEVLKKNASLYP